MSNSSDRLLAVKVLNGLLSESGSLSSWFSRLTAGEPGANLALVREYTYGVCRWYPQLAFFAARLLNKPLRKKDRDIHCLILLGLYQLFHMRTPDHAAINETVAVTLALKKPWAKKLVNAVLRRAQRERDALAAGAEEDTEARHAHPQWLINAIRQNWPDVADNVLLHNNRQGPLTLRVNKGRGGRDQVLRELEAAGIPAQPGRIADTAIILDTPGDVAGIPGFSEGRVSVQDEASQLAASLLDPVAGERVLDACAAPGGKTCALLEHAGGALDLVALDNSTGRLDRVRENLERLKLSARVICADAAEPGAWWDGKPFSAILLDAPCSGTGVIRRHPDIKLLRHAGDIPGLAGLQQQLIAALWPCLERGGRLLYSTCSVLRAENEQVVGAFLSATPDAIPLPLSHPGAHDCPVGMQFLPGPADTDGFYYALLEKQ